MADQPGDRVADVFDPKPRLTAVESAVVGAHPRLDCPETRVHGIERHLGPVDMPH